MYRIQSAYEHQIIIDKSRFICYVKRIFSEEEAKSYIIEIKKMHPNATHHCYAFVIGSNDALQRSNDNGEPSGTAGIPILEALKKNQMSDTIAIVVRYFGGIKLGAGGLIRAYSKSCSEALKHATRTMMQPAYMYTIVFDYDFIGKFDYFLTQHNIRVLDKEYDVQVRYTLQSFIPCDTLIEQLSNGKYIPLFITQEIVEIEVKSL